jgi:hypothetical protein
MLRLEFIHWRKLTSVAFLAALTCMLPTAAAHATPVTYTFTGTGSGTITPASGSGTTFDDAAFSFVFVTDTADIAPFGTEFIIPNATGTFSEGSTTYTVDPIFGIIANPDPSFPRVGFFNVGITSGLTINNSAFAGYNLGTSLGPITAPSGDPTSILLPTLNGTGFSLDSGLDTVVFTANDSLTFTADVENPSTVPEPSTIVLMAAGMLGAGLIYRRSSRQTTSFGMNSIG